MVHKGSAFERFTLNEQIIFHEKQGSNRQCGQHVVNLLVQKPLVTDGDLRAAAKELDSTEAMITGQNPVSQFKSENASSDGYFNISVLEKVLLTHAEMEMRVFTPKLPGGIYDDPVAAEAFLVNSADHWFCWRKIKGIWYELNSLKPFPDKLTNAEFTGKIRGLGGRATIFWVHKTDDSPCPIADDWVFDVRKSQSELASHQNLLTEADMLRAKQEPGGPVKEVPLWTGAGRSLGSSDPTTSALGPYIDPVTIQKVTPPFELSSKSLPTSKRVEESVNSSTPFLAVNSHSCQLAVRSFTGARMVIKCDANALAESILDDAVAHADGKSRFGMRTALPPIRMIEFHEGVITFAGEVVNHKPIREVFLSDAKSKSESYSLCALPGTS